MDKSDRIQKINEAIQNLFEADATKPEKPKPPAGGMNWSAAPSQRTPEQQEYYEKLRAYNLQNQKGLQNFDPDAPQQSYSPAWNVRGEERREQMRAYLNYQRADPERLAAYRQQTNNNTIGKVASFAGRPEAEVQARLAAYNRGAALARAGSIGRHSPGLVEPLVGAAEASYEADVASQNLANVVKRQKSESEIRRQARAERDATEASVRKSNPYGYGEAPITTPSDYIKNLPGMYKSKRQPKPASPQSTAASTGQYKMYNRQTGQIEMSDSPGVDRVFTDSKGDYRVEGGSGKRIYV